MSLGAAQCGPATAPADMDTNAQISPIHTRQAGAEPSIVTFCVSDPDVLLALSEYPEGPARTNFLVTALKVDAISPKAARGTLDADNMRQESERLAVGRWPLAVGRLNAAKPDGACGAWPSRSRSLR
jgi:hypothetical protein